MNNADDHMRLIKAAVKNTLPGADGPITTAAGGHQSRTSGTSAAPAFTFAQEPTLGFFREAAGVIRFVGGTLKGAAPLGGLHMFLVEPTGLGKGAVGTGHEYLELDGSTWPNASFPALAAHLGQAGTTFTLPDAKTTGRFPRSRTATVAAGTAQANTVGPHTHPDVTPTTAAETQDHTHAFSGNTGTDFPDHTHTTYIANIPSSTGGGSFAFQYGANSTQTGGASTRHQHSFSGNTGSRSATHNHTVTVSTPANTGTTETRPEALSFVFCIKT
jgi:hypothetical protein